MSESYVEKEFRGEKFYFIRTPQIEELVNEIFADNYKVLASGIKFKKGDVVLDLGACEGVFSIFMARLFPQVKVLALEPVPRTYGQMMRNLALAGCPNIEPHNIGVGKASERITLFMGLNNYSGGSSAMLTYDPEKTAKVEVDVLSLDDVFEKFKIDRCRLLKIDIEGMEYDVLYNSTMLPRVDYFTGEFHTNWRLDHKGRRMDGLANWVGNRTKVVAIESCRMAE